MKIVFRNSNLTEGPIQVSLDGGQTWNDYRIENVRETGIHLENTQDFSQIKIKGPLDVITTPELFSSISLESDIVFTTDTDTYGFDFPKNVVSVVLPEGLTSINKYAFYEFENLVNINIPKSVTSIGYSAFSYCKGLTSIEIPENVTNIGMNAFSYSGLTSIEIPENVTVIDQYAFSHCSLKSVTIPVSVNNIGLYAFYSNRSLKTVNYLGTRDQWNKIKSGGGLFDWCSQDLLIICQDAIIQ